MVTFLCTESLVGVVKLKEDLRLTKPGLRESNISLGWHDVFRFNCCLRNHKGLRQFPTIKQSANIRQLPAFKPGDIVFCRFDLLHMYNILK